MNKSSTIEGQLRLIARGGTINMAGAVASAAAQFLLVVAVANNFSSEVAGMLFSATSVLLILNAVSALGTDSGLARFILRYESLGRHADVPRCVRIAFQPVLALSLMVAVTLFALSEQLAPRLGLDGDTGTSVLRVLALILPAAVISDFSLAGTRAFGRMRPTVFVDKFTRSVLQPVGAVAVAMVGGGLVWLTAAWALPYVLSMFLGTYLFRAMLASRKSASDAQEATDRRNLRREFWSFTWPRSIARICQIVIQRADIIIIGALLGPRDAAVYTAATRFVVLGQFGVQAIQQVLQPRFSQLLARREIHLVDQIFRVSTSWNMVVSWPIYVITACAAPLYLVLFGKDYQGAGDLVVIVMSIAMMLGTAAGPLDTLLLMSGRSTASLLNAGTALVVDLSLCFYLIPRWGILGGAAAWGMAIIVRNGMTFVQIRHGLGITPLSKAAMIVAGANLTCFALPLIAVRLIGQLTFITFFVTCLLGCAGYLLCLWAARRPLQLNVFRTLLNRRSPRLAVESA